MNILYLGEHGGTSKHRADALVRLGHYVRIIDPRSFLSKHRVIDKWIFETGGLFFEKYLTRRVLSNIGEKRFELVLVNGGGLIGPELAIELRGRFGRVINYNLDDPFGKRDHHKWRLYLNSVPHYDLLVVVRRTNIREAYAAGAKKVLHVFRSADEIAHAPKALTQEDRLRWASDVLFVGTWMPERGPFLAELIEKGVSLTIYGDRWQKAKEWNTLRRAWRGGSIYGDQYAKAFQTAKVCLGLLSKGNRDLHTQRSIEIPFLGCLLCAERTTEHLELYIEGHEAVFWSDAKECANVCKTLLSNEKKRNKIAQQGRRRCIENGHFNEKVMSKILSACFTD